MPGVRMLYMQHAGQKNLAHATRQLARDIHDRVDTRLAHQGFGFRLCSRPGWGSAEQQLSAFLRERKGAAATTLRRDVFGNQALREEKLQIPAQRRPVLVVPTSQVGATGWTEFRDEHQQAELRGADAKRPQFLVIDRGQDPGDLPGSRNHAAPRDLAAHLTHPLALLL
jgi:hypothetical protein